MKKENFVVVDLNVRLNVRKGDIGICKRRKSIQYFYDVFPIITLFRLIFCHLMFANTKIFQPYYYNPTPVR